VIFNFCIEILMLQATNLYISSNGLCIIKILQNGMNHTAAGT
jgi:hypothetical protein